MSRRAAVGVCLFAVAGLTGAPAAGAAPGLSFSAPVLIGGPPYSATHALSAIDCHLTSLCVIGDDAGNVLTSTDPTAATPAWTIASQVSPDARITAVSCASTTFCVAAAGDGAMIVSHDPTGGPSAWRRTAGVLPAGDSVRSLSCPTASLCVGVDRRGAVVASRDPAGGARSWQTVLLTSRRDRLVGIACPSATQCVAVDKKVRAVWHATDPAGRRAAWHAAALHLAAGDYAPAVSCASPTLCVIVGFDQPRGAIDNSVFAATSSDPDGAGSGWRSGTLALEGDDGDSVLTVSCPATTFCAVGAAAGYVDTTVATSTDPAGGASTYQQSIYAKTNIDGPNYPGLLGLSCASASQCVVAGSGGQVGATSMPTSPSLSDWPVSEVDAYNSLRSVACPSATECVAGGSAFSVEASAHPTGGAGAWTAESLPTGDDGLSPAPVDRVSCATIDLCVLGDDEGDLFASPTPLTGGWTEAETGVELADGGPIADLSCVAGPFCVAGAYEVQSDSDNQGTSLLTTVNPTGGTAAWKYGSGWIEGGIDGGPHPAAGDVRSLACASPTLCVAGDAEGGILTNSTPTRAATWRYVQADGKASINALACPSAALCIAVDSQGRILHSTHPTGGVWTSAAVESGVPLTAVSCASAKFCVAVDGQGHAFASSHPTGGVSAWRQISGIDRDLTSIACPTSGLCVAVDSRGNVVTASG